MKYKDLELRRLYKKLLEGLLLIDDFSIDYFSLNGLIRELAVDLVQNPEFDDIQNDKDELLSALKKTNLDFISDESILILLKYSNAEYCRYIFSDYYSLFSELTDTDKIILAIVDLCSDSKLNLIFQSKKFPFVLKDFYHLMEYALGVPEDEFKATMTKLAKLNLVDFDESRNRFKTTRIFSHEILRLSTIPPLYCLDVNDYIVSDYDCAKPLSKIKFVIFAGEDAASFILAKLTAEKTRFWYAESFIECRNIFQYFTENKLCGSECVWMAYRESDSLKNEALLTKMADETGATFIISGKKSDLVGSAYNSVVLKDSSLEKKVDKIFPSEFTESIHDYLKRIVSPDRKKEFITKLYQNMEEMDSYNVHGKISDFFNMFKLRLGKDEINEPEVLCAIDEADFIKRYGQTSHDASLFVDNPNVSAKVQDIRQKLLQPASYLTACKSMLVELEKLIAQHPNILNPEDLFLSLKNSLLFSRENKIFLDPLLLVGSPGCGKSLFCRQLREILGQENDVFISMGSGGGVTNLLGSTPEWRGASNGRILSSIWEANRTGCLLNPIVVLDELDKSCFTSLGSENLQNVLPVLLQLLGDENLRHFQDLYFQVRIQHFFPSIICTANRLEPLLEPHVESLYNRLRVIHFRDYTKQELEDIVIPLKYESFKKYHNELVPEKLSPREIEIIYELSDGQTRQISMAIKKYLGASFDLAGKRHVLSEKEIEKLIQNSKVHYGEKQIGFFR